MGRWTSATWPSFPVPVKLRIAGFSTMAIRSSNRKASASLLRYARLAARSSSAQEPRSRSLLSVVQQIPVLSEESQRESEFERRVAPVREGPLISAILTIGRNSRPRASEHRPDRDVTGG